MAKQPDFVFKQAGALPYRWGGEQVEIVLIKSQSSGEWIFPKGIIDPGETPESIAVKEAVEEAGAVGNLTGAALGCYEQEKWGGVATVEVYPLLVEELLEIGVYVGRDSGSYCHLRTRSKRFPCGSEKFSPNLSRLEERSASVRRIKLPTKRSTLRHDLHPGSHCWNTGAKKWKVIMYYPTWLSIAPEA